jgi:hypothetical protein
MDENEPLEWYELRFLQVVVCLMAAAVPVFWLLFPWSILLGIFAWAILPIILGVVPLEIVFPPGETVLPRPEIVLLIGC